MLAVEVRAQALRQFPDVAGEEPAAQLRTGFEAGAVWAREQALLEAQQTILTGNYNRPEPGVLGMSKSHAYSAGKRSAVAAIEKLRRSTMLEDASAEPTLPELTAPGCEGHSCCTAPVHSHGCFADFGQCDNPDAHRDDGIDE